MGIGDRFKKLFKGRDEPATFEERVAEFWAWWESIAEQFSRDVDAQRASEWSDEVSERLAAVHPELAWETGPGRSSKHHLAISSEGDSVLRVTTERIVARAPKASEHWEYYPARRRAAGDPVGAIRYGDGLEVDYGDVAIAVAPNDLQMTVDLTVFHPSFAAVGEDRAASVTFLLLDDLVGEDDVERWIGSVETVITAPEGALSGPEVRDYIDSFAAEADLDSLALVEMTDKTSGRVLLATWRAGLKRLDHLLFDHHVEIVADVPSADARGLCDGAELESLAEIEDELLEELGSNAVFFGHVTGHGKRTIRLQVLPSSPAVDVVERWIERHPEYSIEFEVSADPSWKSLRDIPGALRRYAG